MKKTMKKAFTLVELLVVIAIVAVLTVAGIVGYTAFTKKAELSNDVGLIAQINTALQGEETEGKNHTFHEARQDVQENGIDLAKIELKSKGLKLAWDRLEDRVVLLDEKNKIIAPEGYNGDGRLKDMFIVAKTQADITGTDYNYYLADNFDAASLNVGVGIDVGTNLDIDIEYTSSAEETRLFNTNGGKLTIDAENATVDHYGTASTVDIKAVAGDSYHENGKILGRIFLAKGHVVVNKTESTQEKAPQIVVTAQSADEVKLDLHTEASVVVENAEIEADLKENIAGSAAEEVKASVTTITTISDANALKSDMQDGYYKLDVNVDLESGITWTNKNITLDLNGHTVTFIYTDYDSKLSACNNKPAQIKDFLNGDDAARYLLVNGGNVTILDSSEEKTGTMKRDVLVGKPLLRVMSQATLTIDSGTYTVNTYSSKDPYSQNLIDLLNGKLVINGGTFKNQRQVPTGVSDLPAFGSGYCINMYPGKPAEHPELGIESWSFELEINGGTFSAVTNTVIFGSATTHGTVTINSGSFQTSAVCLYLPHQGSTTINGGTFEGGTCVVIKSGGLDIKGGTFNANGAANPTPAIYLGTYVVTGDAIAIVSSSDATYQGKPLVYNISGATITSVHGQAIHVYVATGEQEPTVSKSSKENYSYEVTHQS